MYADCVREREMNRKEERGREWEKIEEKAVRNLIKNGPQPKTNLIFKKRKINDNNYNRK